MPHAILAGRGIRYAAAPSLAGVWLYSVRSANGTTHRISDRISSHRRATPHQPNPDEAATSRGKGSLPNQSTDVTNLPTSLLARDRGRTSSYPRQGVPQNRHAPGNFLRQ